MPLDCSELQKAMSPIKDYEDLRRRWREAFAYPFVREAFDFSMPAAAAYARAALGGDTRRRFGATAARLSGIFEQLYSAGVRDILDLTAQADTPEQFEAFVDQSGMQPKDVIAALKFLIYYGKAIGKNLKLGNEIDNSYRIAKIVPVLVRQKARPMGSRRRCA